MTTTDRGNYSPCTELEEASPLRKRKRSGSQSAVGPSRIRKKNVMDKGTRRQLIERDAWANNATPKSVECKGCGRTIKLDKRSDYYPGLWHKHRNKCPAIRRVENSRIKQKV
ncbi:hypothetical protein BDZ94DRAFT_1272695 [Collybia nuda]|uniref:Uncharacterized protein n=1 Tax=Collybia nuda TaxID=64659 RepID=A0A9P6CCZ6_9AGAR|nr:hypothetical protein BDZ94DRAFT_1272695 [Collybia nuda]